jgi:hypothetical protein
MDFPPEVELFEGVTFEAQPDSSASAHVAAIQHQQEVADWWRAICEMALAAKIGGALTGLEILVLGGAIISDPVFALRLEAAIEGWTAAKVAEFGDNFLVSEARFTLQSKEKFPLIVAQSLTRAERVALRGRVRKYLPGK